MRADPWAPVVDAIGFAGGRVAALGSAATVRARVGRHARVIDCDRATVLPGLVDPHLHLFGLAIQAAQVDLRDVHRARDVLTRIAERARTLGPGRWVRAEGLDEHGLDRMPTPEELDRAAAGRPVRLRHRSRHASLLSESARAWLTARGVEVPDHGGGLVAGRQDVLTRAIGPLPASTLVRGLVRVGRELTALGMTTLGDASPRTRAAWAPLEDLVRRGRFGPRVIAMREAGTPRWKGHGRFLAGPVKILVDETPDGMIPDAARLAELVSRAARAGNAVAVHCTGVATLIAALAAFAALPARLRTLPHRLEHVAECPPALIADVARLGLVVVTNPAFVYWRGDVYRRETPPARHGWLYRARTLADAGVPLAAGSDAPVVAPDPWRLMAAARTRRTRAGRVLGARERLDARAALALVTTAAGAALGTPSAGRLVPRGPGDAIVVREDPLRVDAERLALLRPALVVRAGRVVWRR